MMLLQILQPTTLASIPHSFYFRLGIDVVSVFILIRFIYYPIYRNRENVFLFSIFNLLIFMVSYLLNSVDIGMGSAFGLFAVFSILQYRTVKISTKDMTYILLLIGIGLINAVSMASWQVLCLISGLLLATTFLLESGRIWKKEASQTVVYTNLKLVKPDERENLLADLELRLGVKITYVAVKEIDFVKQHALIDICYAVHPDAQPGKAARMDLKKAISGRPVKTGNLKLNGLMSGAPGSGIPYWAEESVSSTNGHHPDLGHHKAKGKGKERR